MQLWRYVVFVSIAIAAASVLVRWGFWFMRSVPMCSWQVSSFRVEHAYEPPYDAVVVLGYAIDYRRLEPTPQLQQRLISAADLFCDAATGLPVQPQPAPFLVLSGGLARQQSVTESVVMSRFLLNRYPKCFVLSPYTATAAVAPAAASASTSALGSVSLSTAESGGARVPLLLESHSVSTRTNAQRTFELLDRVLRGDSNSDSDSESGAGAATASAPPPLSLRVRVVTNPFHQFRTLRVFERVAAEARPTEAGADGAAIHVSMHNCDTPTTDATVEVAASASDNTSARGGHDSPVSTAMPAVRPLSPLVNPQKDWWRECLAIAWYGVRGWL